MAITEGNYNSDWLAWEQDNDYSRKKVTIAESQTITKGEVLGVVTASGQYAAFNQDGDDGTESAAGISLGDYATAASETASGVALVRDAIVIEDNLTFPSDITSGEQATAMASLLALGIITKTEA
ncbi:head decoration protein [Desulfatitalea tepidiphila]|uniref:head decoration protein n=1 Tax=Desulfatitalea tepidiphila TaxID=1185843 RepID=UPI0006B6626E|nr:head decoration protein [Desulfatitalea tepidiphila]